MGMEQAFQKSAADFSGMTGGRDLFISAAIHKAYINVDEKGTEAAAATGIMMEATAMRHEPPPHLLHRRPSLPVPDSRQQIRRHSLYGPRHRPDKVMTCRSAKARAAVLRRTRYFLVVISRTRSILRSACASSGAAKVDATPRLWARPVRPTRCT